MFWSNFSAGCGSESHAAVDEHAKEERSDDRAYEGSTVVEQERPIKHPCDYSGYEARAVGRER